MDTQTGKNMDAICKQIFESGSSLGIWPFSMSARNFEDTNINGQGGPENIDSLLTNFYQTHTIVDSLEYIQVINSKCGSVDTKKPQQERNDRIATMTFIINKADLSWVFPEAHSENAAVYEKCFVHAVTSLYKAVTVPSFDGREDTGYEKSDFPGVAEQAVGAMQLYLAMASKFVEGANNTEKPFGQEIFPRLSTQLTVKSVLLAAEHYKENMWATTASVSIAHKLMENIFKLNMSNSVSELLTCNKTQKNEEIVNVLFSEMKHRLNKENWKQNPSITDVFQFLLFNIKRPYLSNYINILLPPSLLLVDDHRDENKILGIHCLQHILDNSSKAEMKWYSRADVVFDALQKLMYLSNNDIIRPLLQCILSVLAVLEDPVNHGAQLKESNYDTIFRKILTNMEMENKIPARQAYASCLDMFINVMGISVVNHLTQVLRVISEYLEVYDGPQEKARFCVLIALKTLIKVAWPRVANHHIMIVKMLLKLMYDVLLDKTSLNTKEVNGKLVNNVVECLVLLNKATTGKVVKFLQYLSHKDLKILQPYLQKVISTWHKF